MDLAQAGVVITRRTAAGLLLLLWAIAPGAAAPASVDSPEEARIRGLLAEMSLAEKVGQMCLGGRGSRGSYDPLPDALLAVELNGDPASQSQ